MYGDEVWVLWDSEVRAEDSAGIDPSADKHRKVSLSAKNAWLCMMTLCEELWLF